MKTLLNFITALFTITLFIGFFYLRITKKTYEIPLIMPINEQYFPVIFSIWLYSSLIFLLLSFHWLFLKNKKPSKIVTMITLWFQKINIFFKAYGIIFSFLGSKFSLILMSLVRLVLRLSKTQTIIIIFCFVVLPRILVILTLIFEVFFTKSLHYYFYSLLILLLPMIFRFMIFVLEDISPRLLSELKPYLVFDNSDKNVYSINLNNSVKQVNVLSVKFIPEYKDRDLDHFILNFYNPLLFIEGEMEVNFKPLYSKITTLSVLVYLSITATVFGYITLTSII